MRADRIGCITHLRLARTCLGYDADARVCLLQQDMMAPAGEIESAEIAADAGGRSRGYGTVRYTTKEGADAAVATLNGVEFEGRTLTVKLDRYG